MAGEIPERESVLSTTDWLVTLIITAIPIVNIIMLFIWAFGDNANHNRSNFSKAALILSAIGFVFGIASFGIFL